MDILYQSGGAPAVPIRERMTDPLTDSAVRSILRILVNKVQVERTPDGPRYVYRRPWPSRGRGAQQ